MADGLYDWQSAEHLPLMLFAVDMRGYIILLEGRGLAAVGLEPYSRESPGATGPVRSAARSRNG